MRARITLAFVALIFFAVGLAGGGALILVRHSQATAARHNISRAANIITIALQAKDGPDFAKADVSSVIKQIAGVSNETVLEVNGNGTLVGPAPQGIPAAEIGPGRLLDTSNLLHNEVASGTSGGIAFAAAPLIHDQIKGEEVTLALVFEASEDFTSVYYFLFAGIVALVGATLLASLISRQISTRIVRVGRAAERIAGGDFDVRLAGRRRDYPEIAQLDRSINSMAEDLSRAQFQERSFLLSISHDLRTPLTSIRGYAEAISDGAVEDPAHAAGIVLSEAARLERLIGDLLDLARLRSQQFTFAPTTIDLAEAATGAAEALRVAFDSVAVTLTVIDAPRPVLATVDPGRLSQIVSNLLENALKFASAAVVVTISETGDQATIAVEDDGPGIDEVDLPHVLERLFTSDRHQARAAGTGLGLAIVTELATAMDGHVSVVSPVVDGRGTRITVSLPATPDDLRPGTPPTTDGPPRTRAG